LIEAKINVTLFVICEI